jgi:hypothetical protein
MEKRMNIFSHKANLSVFFLGISLFGLAAANRLVVAQETEKDQGHNRCRQREFGKFSDWSEPVNLGPVVNSEADDHHPAISANGLSLYITSTRPGGFGGEDIWVSQRASVDDDWGPPQNLGPVINTASNDAAPNFSPDGHWMYFHSPRPGGCGNADLYVSYRANTTDDFSWEPPVNLGCAINTEFFENGPTYFQDDATGTVTMYFNRTPGEIGHANIYASTLGDDGLFGPAVLVVELSSEGTDGRTAIRRDGLEMLVSSNRSGSIGTSDIWVSTRESILDPWSTPVNLGPPINSGSTDGGSALSCDGTTLYFLSTRPGGFGGRDLYMTTRTELCDNKDDSDNNGRGEHHSCKEK